MAPSTSERQTVLAALETALTAITAGATYNYTPDAVVIADAPMLPWLDRDRGLVYYISEEDDPEEIDTFAKRECILEVFLVGAKTYAPDADDPFQATGETRSQVRNKMIQDLRTLLAADPTLSGTCISALITMTRVLVIDVPLATPATGTIPRWAAFESRLELTYRYDS